MAWFDVVLAWYGVLLVSYGVVLAWYGHNIGVVCAPAQTRPRLACPWSFLTRHAQRVPRLETHYPGWSFFASAKPGRWSEKRRNALIVRMSEVPALALLAGSRGARWCRCQCQCLLTLPEMTTCSWMYSCTSTFMSIFGVKMRNTIRMSWMKRVIKTSHGSSTFDQKFLSKVSSSKLLHVTWVMKHAGHLIWCMLYS